MIPGAVEGGLAAVAVVGALFWLHAGTRLLSVSRSRFFPRLPDLPPRTRHPEGGPA